MVINVRHVLETCLRACVPGSLCACVPAWQSFCLYGCLRACVLRACAPTCLRGCVFPHYSYYFFLPSYQYCINPLTKAYISILTYLFYSVAPEASRGSHNRVHQHPKTLLTTPRTYTVASWAVFRAHTRTTKPTSSI